RNPRGRPLRPHGRGTVPPARGGRGRRVPGRRQPHQRDALSRPRHAPRAAAAGGTRATAPEPSLPADRQPRGAAAMTYPETTTMQDTMANTPFAEHENDAPWNTAAP